MDAKLRHSSQCCSWQADLQPLDTAQDSRDKGSCRAPSAQPHMQQHCSSSRARLEVLSKQRAKLQQHAELSALCPNVPLPKSWVGQLCHLLHAEMTTENGSPARGPAPPTLTSCFSHKGIAEATCKQEHSSSGDHTCASSEQGSIPEHKQAACWSSQTSLGDGAAKSLQLFTSKFLPHTACSSAHAK